MTSEVIISGTSNYTVVYLGRSTGPQGVLEALLEKLKSGGYYNTTPISLAIARFQSVSCVSRDSARSYRVFYFSAPLHLHKMHISFYESAERLSYRLKLRARIIYSRNNNFPRDKRRANTAVRFAPRRPIDYPAAASRSTAYISASDSPDVAGKWRGMKRKLSKNGMVRRKTYSVTVVAARRRRAIAARPFPHDRVGGRLPPAEESRT